MYVLFLQFGSHKATATAPGTLQVCAALQTSTCSVLCVCWSIFLLFRCMVVLGVFVCCIRRSLLDDRPSCFSITVSMVTKWEPNINSYFRRNLEPSGQIADFSKVPLALITLNLSNSGLCYHYLYQVTENYRSGLASIHATIFIPNIRPLITYLLRYIFVKIIT
jgi:hypothetical protein